MDPIQVKQLSELIRKSISFGQAHSHQLSDFVRCHAQEMEEDVIKKHIELYVNDQSLGLDENGKKAVQCMFALTGLQTEHQLIAE